MSAPVVLDWQLPNAKPSHRFEADLELASGPNGSSFHCDSCGANVDVPPGKSSLRCPFCDSTYVVEIPKESRRTEPPEFVIGFTITREKALELFFRWLGRNSWFRPGDLQAKASTDRQQGIYLPFWHFSMVADSNWSAKIGEHWYRTETYVVKTSDGKTENRSRNRVVAALW
jgi:DNA-directed RNA polymerase subunit RPC12/RpoP